VRRASGSLLLEGEEELSLHLRDFGPIDICIRNDRVRIPFVSLFRLLWEKNTGGAFRNHHLNITDSGVTIATLPKTPIRLSGAPCPALRLSSFRCVQESES
jgi:hypothetical protein